MCLFPVCCVLLIGSYSIFQAKGNTILLHLPENSDPKMNSVEFLQCQYLHLHKLLRRMKKYKGLSIVVLFCLHIFGTLQFITHHAIKMCETAVE
ncbi:hypothetical protein XELAEV_18022406mg [Xenopus laevis]|uniref:Uncharacterized protein n=1 Tax=Xenopus laevis TaxID=8355 RepID=A0A974HNN3_XENLA|nr:hypothetical protein XELAEV_18022406mg [Xenopus laevis]